jgi:hypothetical protein
METRRLGSLSGKKIRATYYRGNQVFWVENVVRQFEKEPVALRGEGSSSVRAKEFIFLTDAKRRLHIDLTGFSWCESAIDLCKVDLSYCL